MDQQEKIGMLLTYAATNNHSFEQAMRDRVAKLISAYLIEEKTHKKVMEVLDTVEVIEFTVLFVMRLWAERTLTKVPILEAELRCAQTLEDGRDIFADLAWCERKDFNLPESLAIAEANLREERRKLKATKKCIEDTDKLLYSLCPGSSHLWPEELIEEAIQTSREIAASVETSELREKVKKITSSAPNRAEVLDLLGLGP
jgi:hypothetical protein